MPRSTVDLEPELARLLSEVKQRLASAFGSRLRGLIFYGSRARGDYHEESDIDLMVLLDPPVEYARDRNKIIDTVYDLQLQSGMMLSARPIDVEVFERGEWAIYRTAKREGIVL